MQVLRTERDCSVDILKTAAIFGVAVIHVCSAGYYSRFMGADWLSSVFWGSAMRGSVPVFLMCSGALMLDRGRELPIGRLYGKNILRLVLAMLFWAAAYKVFHLVRAGGADAALLWQAAKEILLFRHEFHFYYIHITLLVYVLLPIVRKFTAYAEKRELVYALAVWLALGILYPTLRPFWPFSLISGIPAQWGLSMPYAAIGYCLLGYYLKTYPQKLVYGILLFSAGFALTFGATVLMSRDGQLYTGFLEGMTAGPCATAAGLFIIAGRIRVRRARFFAFVSRASFCIFLSHMLFIYVLKDFGITARSAPCIVSIPLIAIAVTAAGAAVYAVLSRIPLVSKYLV